MITSSTYRDRIDRSRDMLAAFSALDHCTTGSMDEAAVTVAYRGLLTRLVALLFLRSPETAAAFIDLERREGGDLVDIACSFLEFGTAGVVEGSELQQELVHFSRIVDVGAVGFDDPRAERALRRLHGSHRLPEPLKVLSELIIVMRSRLLQRGATLSVPSLRSGRTRVDDAPRSCAVSTPEVAADHLVLVRSERRRDCRQSCYLFSALLAYLTPVEAALTLWAYRMATAAPRPMTLATAILVPGDDAQVVTWRVGDELTDPEYEWELPAAVTIPRTELAARLERAVGVPATCTLSDGAVRIHLGQRLTVDLADPAAGPAPTVGRMQEAVRRRLDSIRRVRIQSIELGHVHLDRNLDVDQEVGIALGATAFEVLSARQPMAPRLTPMLDDDHVMVRLRPRKYVAYLAQRMPGKAMHLIVESSPVIRSIVAVLYRRLVDLAGDRLRHRGGNLFVQTGADTFCEVFEDLAGTMATGCVFFEAALLTYRCAPERFDDHFRRRFGLDADVHEQACAILDGDEPHDDKVTRLTAFYRQFAEVTDPNRPDRQIDALVTELLDTREPIAHLNVLEDYYEVQQDKVRQILTLLRLPLRLLTVHFNAQTGRIVLDG